MKIHHLTITGADNQTPIEQVVSLSEAFPILEWGILLSKKSLGKISYPDLEWIDRLSSASSAINISGHICGIWLHEILQGKFPGDLIPRRFNRIQINLARYIPQVRIQNLNKSLPHDKSYILQVGEYYQQGISLARDLILANYQVAILYDVSGGSGISPTEWKVFPEDIPVGYAGGLGPDNLLPELKKLESIVGNRSIWIDMQAGIRIANNRSIDFGKIQACIDIVNSFNTQSL
jgi:hypothetical protein